MTRYIDKSALVAEIERRLWLLVPKMAFHQQRAELEKLLSFIDTLEVKEADLEKEYKDFVKEDPVYNKLVNDIAGKAIARHFFELGLKAQKG